MTNVTDLTWEAPGPGFWSTDKVHWAHPQSPLDAAGRACGQAGGRESLRTYGSLVDGFETELVNGFAYARPRAAIFAIEGETKEQFLARAGANPEVISRFAAAEHTMRTRRWREDLVRWDNHIKPALMAANGALGSIDPRVLDGVALRDHAERCFEHWKHTLYMHHVPNMTWSLPAGLLIAFVTSETGKSATDAVGLLTGTSDVSGANSLEATALRAAVRQDAAFMSWASSAQPDAEFIAAAQGWPGDAGRACRKYVRHAGFLLGALELTQPCAIERPELFAQSFKSVIFAEGGEPGSAPNLDQWRSAVPRERWPEFEDLLAEARLVARLRDERGVYCNGPARGIFRMTLFEMGRRLVARGTLAEPEHILEASFEDLLGLFERGAGPSAETLRDLAVWRASSPSSAIPLTLGAPPPRPINPDWLPEAARAIARAGAATQPLGAVGGPAIGITTDGEETRGAGAAPGTYTGTAIVIHDVAELDNVEPGAVLVTRSTASSFNVVFPLIGAIVTDFGGVLSHAAIMAREFGIPCVAGAGTATAAIRTGDVVTVDGISGVVTIVSRSPV